jgi:hypothetical protein
MRGRGHHPVGIVAAAVRARKTSGMTDRGEELVLGHSDRRFAIKALLITGVLLALAAALLWFILHTVTGYNTNAACATLVLFGLSLAAFVACIAKLQSRQMTTITSNEIRHKQRTLFSREASVRLVFPLSGVTHLARVSSREHDIIYLGRESDHTVWQMRRTNYGLGEESWNGLFEFLAFHHPEAAARGEEAGWNRRSIRSPFRKDWILRDVWELLGWESAPETDPTAQKLADESEKTDGRV